MTKLERRNLTLLNGDEDSEHEDDDSDEISEVSLTKDAFVIEMKPFSSLSVVKMQQPTIIEKDK